MNDFGTKFQLIIKPFLIVCIASICVYSFVHWWLFVENEIFLLDEAITNFIGPIAVAVAVVWIWMRPRLKLLDFAAKKIAKNPLTGFFLLCSVAIAVPTIIAQEYLISAAGKLTELSAISDISNRPKTKYYKVKHVFADKEQMRQYTNINTSGKYNVNYNMDVYMPCPIYDTKVSQTQSETREPFAWLGIKYHKTISNNLSGEDKTQAFETFVKQSENDFEKRDLTTFSYLDRIGPNRQLSFFTDAVTFSGVNDAPFIILVPRWGKFEDRNGDKALWFIGSLLIGTLIFSIAVATVPLKAGLADNNSTKYQFESYKLE